MKIIEALKKAKDLQRKAEDIRKKIKDNCADLDNETPAYGTVEKQKEQITEWLQAHSDILKEIENLRVKIQYTNLKTEVTIEVSDNKFVKKAIANWIHRKKDLARYEAEAWSALGLTNRKLQPAAYKKEGSDEVFIANIRKYYDQKTRDQMVEIYTSELSRIDAALEIANAINDIVE